MSLAWSDGHERPDWYEGTSLDRGIHEYCERFTDAELARLRAENADLRKQLAALGKAHAATASR